MVNVLPQLNQIKGAALDFLFPRFCVGCGKEGSFICSPCLAELKRIEPPICAKCGIPLASSAGSNQNGSFVCTNCAGWEMQIDGIRSAFEFDGVMRKAIHEFKYRNLRAISVQLAQFLAAYLSENPLVYDIIVPVPLHSKRLRERGYNQAGLLSSELSKLTCVPLNDSSLIRSVYNVQQARTAGLEERHKNVIGIFEVMGVDLLKKNVLLIDDVTTSGATLNACAAVLKAAGTNSVWGLTLAREI